MSEIADAAPRGGSAIPRDLGLVRKVGAPGTPVASFVLLMLAASATSLMGCLVTDAIEIPTETPYPPSIVAVAPGDAFVVFDRETERQLELEFAVRDPNVFQDLEWKAFLDRAQFDGNVIRAAGELERTVEFTVPTSSLGAEPPCHKLEVVVSSGFKPGFAVREPVVPGDVAEIVWWVGVTGFGVTEAPRIDECL